MHDQYQLFDMNLSDVLDSLIARLPNNSAQNNPPPVEPKSKTSSIVKSCVNNFKRLRRNFSTIFFNSLRKQSVQQIL